MRDTPTDALLTLLQEERAAILAGELAGVALALGAPSGGRLDYRSERFTLDAGIRRQ